MAHKINPYEKPVLLTSPVNPTEMDMEEFIRAVDQMIAARKNARGESLNKTDPAGTNKQADTDAINNDPNYGLVPFQPGFSNMMRRMHEDQIEQSGFTIDPATGGTPRSGYRVAVHADRRIAYVRTLSKKRAEEIIEEYINKNKDLLKKKNTYLRGYEYKEKYNMLEISVRVMTHDDAIGICLKHNLKVYWGFKEKTTFWASGNNDDEKG